MRLLVTGAAGYIGSHACRTLLLAGVEHLVAVDSLARGHAGAVHALTGLGGARFRFAELDIHRTADLARLLAAERAWAVLHFAGLAQVAESVRDPAAYEHANAEGTASVLAAMTQAGVERLVLSSSAAVYGAPTGGHVPEAAPLCPVNPYGATKCAAERLVTAWATAGRAAAMLRYFNVAGAASDGSLGEDHRPETHLIPCALRAALGQGGVLRVFGTDYDTPDGTCMRDYVHVDDVARANLAALSALRPGDCTAFNIGTGHAVSVRRVIDECQRVSGRAIAAEFHPRRPGDPASLVADMTRTHAALAWRATESTLTTMVASAWSWLRTHPDGYGTAPRRSHITV